MPKKKRSSKQRTLKTQRDEQPDKIVIPACNCPCTLFHHDEIVFEKRTLESGHVYYAAKMDLRFRSRRADKH